MENLIQSQNLILSQIPVSDLVNAISSEILEKITPLIPATKPEQPKQSERLMTRKEVSKLLKISLPTLHKYTITGKIPAQRIVRQVRYNESEVMAAMTRIKTI